MSVQLTLVETVEERDARFINKQVRQLTSKLFYSHIKGWENLKGKKVIEIGGLKRDNISKFVDSHQAEYRGVTLNEGYHPAVQGNTDIVNYSGDPVDVIVANQVFERDALGRAHSQFIIPRVYDLRTYLRKLSSLLHHGGVALLGASTGVILFPNQLLREEGFSVEYRENPFPSLGVNGYNEDCHQGELVVMRKLG